ncbi:GGDEF domain-containing protein [Rhizobium sp. PAMB 3182]
MADWIQVAAASAVGTFVCIVLTLLFDVDVLIEVPAGRRLWAVLDHMFVPLVIAFPNFLLASWKIAQLRVARRALEVLAMTDGLTGTLNRRAFACQVDETLRRPVKGEKQDRIDAMMVVDVDHFKRVNDTFGHEVGDRALQTVTSAVAASLPQGALFGRLGGEEFAVFMHDTVPSVATLAAENIRLAVATSKFEVGGVTYPLNVSIGVACADNAGGFRDLYHQADLCLYAAKEDGRNRVVAKRLSIKSRAAA